MRAIFCFLVMLLGACGAPAHDEHRAPATSPAQSAATANSIEIRDGWATPTPGGVDVSAGYATIVNGTDADDQLVGATSPRAARVELHEMAMDDEVMRMRRAETLVIPAHGQIELAPHGRHLMFFGVAQAFSPGEHIPVTLTFTHAGAVETTLTVRLAGH